jgi:hypothetical protein
VDQRFEGGANGLEDEAKGPDMERTSPRRQRVGPQTVDGQTRRRRALDVELVGGRPGIIELGDRQRRRLVGRLDEPAIDAIANERIEQ